MLETIWSTRRISSEELTTEPKMILENLGAFLGARSAWDPHPTLDSNFKVEIL